VYDITEFVNQHPGGSKRIMLAAGGSVDAFWAMYAQHQKKEVAQLLEAYRVGSLVRARFPPVTRSASFVSNPLEMLGMQSIRPAFLDSDIQAC
jgi:cytochrome b involved in lipid metabolism